MQDGDPTDGADASAQPGNLRCATGPGATAEAPTRSWQVRPARSDDAVACAALAVVAWQRVHDAFASMLSDELHDFLFTGWQAAKARDVARVVGDQPGRALVAVADEQIVGFVTFRLDEARQVGEIGNNAVDPQWQGRGIATTLYRAVLELMREGGMRVAKVTTGLDEGHAPARASYGKVGFAVGTPSITYYQRLDGAPLDPPAQ
jgi:ribosomal protein S18 acetylase RimI-like enzyme